MDGRGRSPALVLVDCAGLVHLTGLVCPTGTTLVGHLVGSAIASRANLMGSQRRDVHSLPCRSARCGPGRSPIDAKPVSTDADPAYAPEAIT